MIVKDFLYKLKEDLKKLNFYPTADFSIMGKVNYDSYWAKRRKNKSAVLSSWQKQRVDAICNMINPNSSILDMGCGDGAVLKYIMDKTGARGIGIDFNESELNKAKILGIETYIVDLRNEKQINTLPKADYLIGFEILEHMPEPENIIYQFKDKIKYSMFFSFPNSGYYLHRLRFLFGKFPLQWIVHPGEHLRFWTTKDVKWWVRSLGFELNNLVLYEGLPFLNKIFPSLFAQGIIINISENKK
jgi:methionine biosynthesis protein MetW